MIHNYLFTLHQIYKYYWQEPYVSLTSHPGRTFLLATCEAFVSCNNYCLPFQSQLGYYGPSYSSLYCVTHIETLQLWDVPEARLLLCILWALTLHLNTSFSNTNIVIRGDWLWKAANINDKNNSAAVYVQSTVKVHNPLFSVGKLLRNKLMQRFYWSIQSKW